jgi:hypothetical protein
MSDDGEMNCVDLSRVAAELALGVLTGRERALAVAHLDTCEECAEDVRQLMATGEQLLELLPPAEPPVGFETRVLAHLGLPVPAGEPTQPLPTAQPLPPSPPGRHGADRNRVALDGADDDSADEDSAGKRGPGRGAAGGGGAGRGPGRGAGQGHGPGPGPGLAGRRMSGRLRRALSVAAVCLAVVAAGVGGWAAGSATSAPTATAAASQLAPASLVAAGGANIGQVFLYSGSPQWVYMWVDMETGNESVTCQLVTADGKTHTLGSFQLADGYGSWASPNPGSFENVTGARLLSATGSVLATATFPH